MVYQFKYFTSEVYFQYQSYIFGFSDWISLITLCLAPLIAHIISGVPSPTYSCSARPQWHDRIVLYNPVSIAWRYMVVADRRVRAERWDEADLATTNSLFWTPYGWNGSEALAENSRHFLIRRPPSAKAALFSSSVISTIICTLQGIQGIYVLALQSTSRRDEYTHSFATMFVYLTILGLSRLPAAFWLTDDYAFSYDDLPDTPSEVDASNTRELSFRELQSQSLLPSHNESTLDNITSKNGRYFARTWRNSFLRLAYLLFLLLLAIMSMYLVLFDPWINSSVSHPLSDILVGWLYLFAIVPGFAIFGTYSFRTTNGIATSTALPCLGHLWYKTFTIIWVVLVIFTMIVTALQTTMSSCGQYTTSLYNNNATCNH
jgi:hypothetical protein